MINLQHHVIREKKLHEKDAILIFFEIVNVVSSLHRVSNLQIPILLHKLVRMKLVKIVTQKAGLLNVFGLILYLIGSYQC